ncbi:DnaG DNA primase (bacterial type) [Burkholderiales bacterium]
MIPQSFIDSLLQRVDIVELVGTHVQLKKAGANYSGLCPFHTEKSPSFTVSPSKQFYHCFGCGAHGTAIGFLIEHTGLSFPQAVEELARRSGLEVPREAEPSEASKAPRELQARLQDRMLAAAKFYQRRLRESSEAIDYLKGRGITGETAARYHLGFAPEGWQPLQAVFGDYDHPDLAEAGLVIASEEGGRAKRYDRFRHRLMFPILSGRGDVIGFGARSLGQEEPKYLNSPETPLFIKGQSLYGLFEGRQAIRAAGEVWVVEGYMDVVALSQHGLGHAVATLGTATTPDHLRLLSRLTSKVVFMFDGDAAGRRAAAKALEVALPFAQERLLMRFAFLPPEHDPDSFVRAMGADALRAHVNAASPLSSFLASRATEGQDLSSAEGRAAATVEARRLIALMPPSDLRNQIAQSLAEQLGADAGSLGAARLTRVAAPANEHSERAPARGARVTARPSAGRRSSPVTPLSLRLLQIAVRLPPLANALSQGARSEMPEDQRRALDWVAGRVAQHGGGFAALFEALEREASPEIRQLLSAAMAPEPGLDDLAERAPDQLQEAFAQASRSLELRALEARAAELAEAGDDPAQRNALRVLHQEITALRKSLQR